MAYEVRPITGGLHAVLQLQAQGLPDHAADYGAFEAAEVKRQSARSSSDPMAAPLPVPARGGDSISVLVAYTSDLANATADPAAFAQAAVDALNLSLDNSETLPRFALVHAYETPTPSAGSTSPDLSGLAGLADGRFDEAHAFRDAYAADLVVLLGPSSSVYGSCGRGYLGSGEAEAFTVTAYSCAIGNLTFAHEIGHNMGCLL